MYVAVDMEGDLEKRLRPIGPTRTSRLLNKLQKTLFSLLVQCGGGMHNVSVWVELRFFYRQSHVPPVPSIEH